MERDVVLMKRHNINAVRRVTFVMKGGVVYKNVPRGAIPKYAGIEP